MTGKQFKSIRRFNRFSQNDFSYNSGLCGRTTLHFVEKLELVPQKYVIELSNMLELKLTDDKILENYLEKIPQK